MIKKTILDITDVLGRPIDTTKFEIIERGLPHSVPRKLPTGKMAVYTFIYNGTFLKIGKVGPNSNARYTSQHYNPGSSKSNLAKSILEDPDMKTHCITENNIGTWIKNNCHRIDIEMDVSLGIFTLELVEAVLHYKLNPKYEGFSSQRNIG